MGLRYSSNCNVEIEQAAAMAAASMIFRENGERQYGNTLLRHAVQLYRFATRFQGHYNESFPEVAQFYKYVLHQSTREM